MGSTEAPTRRGPQFSALLWLTLGAFGCFALTLALYVRSERLLDRAHEARYESYLLADELRQSSDDLTRMVRTYVITADPQYKRYYHEILQIRRGSYQRPAAYQSTYWNLAPWGEQRPGTQGTTRSLHERMRQASFSSPELDKLNEALAASDALSELEIQLMAEFEAGAPSPEVARNNATRKLHDPMYHQAKAGIMRPIDEFYRMAEQRTATAVHQAAAESMRMRIIFAGAGLVFVFLVFRLHRSLYRVLGGTLDDVHAGIKALGQGDFNQGAALQHGDDDSVLSWLAESRSKLARSDAERIQSESIAKASARRFRDIVDTVEGIVWEARADSFLFTFVSEQAERLLGYPCAAWLEPDFWPDHLHPDDRESALTRRTDLAYKHQSRELEYRMIAADGHIVWLQDFVAVVEEEDRSLWLRGVMVDVTDRKTSMERHRAVVASAMDAFMRIAISGDIIECNAAASALTGYSQDELLQLSIPKVEAIESPHDVEEHIGKILRDGKDRFESRWVKKDGTIIDVEVTASYLSISQEICAFVRDITHHKQHQNELDRIAHYDPLTGLANRTLLADRMHLAWNQAQRAGHSIAVCYIDLDGFKPVNDLHGHEVGDDVLVETARRLESCVRAGDTVARIGGDEFVLILNLQQPAEYEDALTRALEAVNGPIHSNNLKVTVSASVGVAIFPEDGADVETLLRHADQAMYVAKQAGKNRYHLFDAEHDRITRNARSHLQQIQSGLDRNDFVLHYQPQVDMRKGQVIGVEALVRWDKPRSAILPPAEFIPFIEDHDLVIEIGEWVIGAALDQLVLWQDQGIDIKLSVNIAARHLQCADFPLRLRNQLSRHPSIDPSRFVIEILETAALDRISGLSDLMAQCQELGVEFALDDFGTGYSSLTFLKALPAQTLKIDRTFVRDILNDESDRAIVEGVIGLARVFGRHVIAEGVETNAHGVLLMQLGCDLAQGYGIARPMPAAQISDWIRNWQCPAAWRDSQQAFNAIQAARIDTLRRL